MRKVYFSFHYSRDVWRVSQVRNSWLIKPDNKATPFLDKASWEQVKRYGDDNVKAWIRRQMQDTSVTVVLIGNQTSQRNWVLFEIEESYKKGNGILGIYIHNLKDQQGFMDRPGNNPFDNVWINNYGGTRTYFSSLHPTYDWVLDNGRENIGLWIERAVK